MDIAELKRLLRLKMHNFRKTVSPEKIQDTSDAVIQNCLNALDLKNIKSIQVYLPIANLKEINTWPLLQHIWKLYPHIDISVPVIRNDKIYSAPIDGETMLQPARYGTVEPLHPALLPGNHKFDLVIVPMLGFDRRGRRLGYGKGFYDRFLSEHSGRTIGLAYAKSEITPDIPEDSHDIALDFIATERELITTR